MRLRLSIQRHELPVIKILWHVTADCTTISKLLEQVSDVVPLESDGWGIEDYAAQVNGYECLHYLDPHTILNEDDEVCIRALQTSDIRVRTVSGRHQISSAGAHLIDGIAFGRSYLRRPDRPRPPIHIPPRKRRRLSYDYYGGHGVENSTTHEPGRQLRLTATFDNADGIEEDEDNTEPDFEPEHEFNFTQDALPDTGRLRSGKRRKSVSFDESSSSAAPSFDIFEDGGTDDGSDDEDFEVAGSNTSHSDDEKDEITDSDANALKPSTRSSTNRKSKLRTSTSRSTSPTSSAASSTTSTSDSSSSASSPASSSNDDSSRSNNSDKSDGSDSSNSDSSISSSCDEKDESTTLSNQMLENTVVKSTRKGTKSSQKSRPQQANRTPPGKGTQSTRSRNERRRKGKKLKYLQRMGLTEVPAKEAFLQTEKLPAESTSASAEADFERRRQELLDAIALGGVDIDEDISPMPSPRIAVENADHKTPSMEMPVVAMTVGNPMVETAQDKGRPAEPRDVSISDVNFPSHLIGREASTGPIVLAVPTMVQEELEAKERRNKLDVASSRRLLFGSLGVRTPRNAADEEKLRTQLSEKAKRGRKMVGTPTSSSNAKSGATEQEGTGILNMTTDVDAWKDRIRLTAVECCDRDVILSTPPFPFVQRWDPQQQFLKGEARAKKRKRKGQHFEDNEVQSQANDLYLEYDDPPEELPIGQADDYDEVTSQLQQEIIRSSQEADSDLPLLPSDMSSLPDLKQSETQPSAVIAFKQLECSQATNWQPRISAYRTALIDAVDSELHLTLAKRDSAPKEHRHDADGNRIYGKFELVEDFPDEDEDDEGHEAHSGGLAILATDLIEPKLIRAALKSSLGPTFARDEDVDELASPTLIVQDSMAFETGESGDAAQDSMFTNENVAADGDSHWGIVDENEGGNAEAGKDVQVGSRLSQRSSTSFVDAPATQSVALAEGVVVVAG